MSLHHGLAEMCSSYVVLLVLSHLQLSSGASSANASDTVQTVGWQSDPNGRGTFTLVSSCLLTLFICVYSAMHLNVPPHRESSWQFWLRTIKWGMLGVFGPELVIFLVWKQYLSAKDMVQRSRKQANIKQVPKMEGWTDKHIAKASVQAISSTAGTPATPWSLTHGFYAGMGGFTFPSSGIWTGFGRLTLTARGVALLAECNCLPDIEREDILDKSKSDGLSKFIACVQAAWMIVEVIGRLIMRLGVTQLEINTLGHVFCALIIYALWWHKPRLIEQPTTLTGDWVGPLCAYMYMSSRISGRIDTAKEVGDRKTGPEISTVAFFPGRPCPHSCVRASLCQNATNHQPSPDDFARQRRATASHLHISSEISTTADSPGSRVGSFENLSTLYRTSMSSAYEASRIDVSDEDQDLGIERRLRWCLAAEAVRTYPAVHRRFKATEYIEASGQTTTYLQEHQPEELLVQCSTNWSREGLLPGDSGLVMGMVLWSASMAFGGIHAAAWHSYFPSKVESKIWRISSVYISSSGLLWCIINVLAKLSKPFDDYWNRTVLPHPPFARSKALVGCCAVCGAMYVFARLYLVVEAFVSIRKLPVAAYETPNWAQLIPHF